MDDQKFLQQFEVATLTAFPHRDHIRMAWLYLRRDGWEMGYTHIQTGLEHFAETLGQADKYHETITRFWSLLVDHAIQQQPDIDTFERFAEAFPILFDGDALKRHYSADALTDTRARTDWIEPDLIPMP